MHRIGRWVGCVLGHHHVWGWSLFLPVDALDSGVAGGYSVAVATRQVRGVVCGVAATPPVVALATSY